LEEQHYKDLEGTVLAAQSAQLSKTDPDGELALAGPRQPQSDKADKLRRLALAAAPHGANADTALQKALAGLQQPGGAPQRRSRRTPPSSMQRLRRQTTATSPQRGTHQAQPPVGGVSSVCATR
jgi:hypothetical protein